MNISINLNVPQEVVDLILAKAKELGCEKPKDEKLLVTDTMTAVVKNNLYVYAHEGMKETLDLWFDHNSDDFEDLLANQR